MCLRNHRSSARTWRQGNFSMLCVTASLEAPVPNELILSCNRPLAGGPAHESEIVPVARRQRANACASSGCGVKL